MSIASQRGFRSGVLAPSTPLLHSGRIVVRRTQEPSKGFKRRFRYVMLDSFGVSFSSFDGDAHRDKCIYDEPMAGAHSYR